VDKSKSFFLKKCNFARMKYYRRQVELVESIFYMGFILVSFVK